VFVSDKTFQPSVMFLKARKLHYMWAPEKL